MHGSSVEAPLLLYEFLPPSQQLNHHQLPSGLPAPLLVADVMGGSDPFLDTPNARPETWALGFRNPWRLTCDEKTGHIWVGENGQDLWESAKLVEKGILQRGGAAVPPWFPEEDSPEAPVGILSARIWVSTISAMASANE